MQSARPGFSSYIIIFFFNATATTEIYTLSLHDALPISSVVVPVEEAELLLAVRRIVGGVEVDRDPRSEEHTSELQSLTNIVCRLLLEKKKKQNILRRSALYASNYKSPARE